MYLHNFAKHDSKSFGGNKNLLKFFNIIVSNVKYITYAIQRVDLLLRLVGTDFSLLRNAWRRRSVGRCVVSSNGQVLAHACLCMRHIHIATGARVCMLCANERTTAKTMNTNQNKQLTRLYFALTHFSSLVFCTRAKRLNTLRSCLCWKYFLWISAIFFIQCLLFSDKISRNTQ